MEAKSVIAVVGLGYVGLPLALAFGRTHRTIGFDISERRISNYRRGKTTEGEAPESDFPLAKKLEFTTDPTALKEADFIIVAVPTPIDSAKQPDLSPLEKASESVGKHMKRGAVIVYESTVYPGVTEEICAPILEKFSGMKSGVDFKLGYSPERINPGDTKHLLRNVTKVVAGQDAATLEQVAALYRLVVTEADVYKAPSIKCAEAAKVIENTQRDLNIALVNELAIIFNRMGLDTLDVLETAGTKWNFLPFRPGLVGGHCIGVDPYYLTHKAELIGYHPQVILAGRRINDSMGKYVAEQTIKQMIANNTPINGAKALILGITFKENCADVRNSRVVDVIEELKTYGVEALVWDPVANAEETKDEYGINLVDIKDIPRVDAVIAAVPHQEVLALNFEMLLDKCARRTPFIDVKSAFNREQVARAGFRLWRL